MELINWGRYILSQDPAKNWSKLVKSTHGLLCHEYSIVKKHSRTTYIEMLRKTNTICEELGNRMEKEAQAKKIKGNKQNVKQKFRNAWKKSIEIVQSLLHSSSNKFVELFRSAYLA
jgi:hypothetical protein